MATGFGSNAWLGFAEESTYGTYVSPTKFLEITEENVIGEQSWIPKNTLRSASQSQKVRSKKNVSGSFKANLGFTGFERIFKHALGSSATTGAGPYTHTASLASALPVGLSLHVNRDADAVGTGSAFKYEGCQITKLTLAQEVEAIATIEVEILGEDFGNVNVATPTFPTFEQCDWESFSLFIGGNIDDYVQVKNFEISIENQAADDRYVLGSRIRVGVGRSGPRKISGKFGMEFASLALYTEWANLSDVATIVAKWDNGLSGSSQRKIEISAEAVIQSGSPAVSDPGPIVVEFTFEGFSSSANSELSVVSINGTSTI